MDESGVWPRWETDCCVLSKKELHGLQASAPIFVQLALPQGTWPCPQAPGDDTGNIARTMKMGNGLLVWPESQRGRAWDDGSKTGVSHKRFQDGGTRS